VPCAFCLKMVDVNVEFHDFFTGELDSGDYTENETSYLCPHCKADCEVEVRMEYEFHLEDNTVCCCPEDKHEMYTNKEFYQKCRKCNYEIYTGQHNLPCVDLFPTAGIN